MVLPPKNLSIPFEPSLHSPDQPLLSVLFHTLSEVAAISTLAAQGPGSQGSLGMRLQSV